MPSWDAHHLQRSVDGTGNLVWRCGEFLEENPSPPPHVPQGKAPDTPKIYWDTHQAHDTAFPHTAKPHRKVLSREEQGLICPDTFSELFSLVLPRLSLFPGYWARRLLAKHGRNKRKDIGKSPVIAEPSDIPCVQLPALPGAGAARNVPGLGQKYKKFCRSAGRDWGSRKAWQAQVWPELRPAFISRVDTKPNTSLVSWMLQGH